jgi:50S ribosomal protein L16 3-hydroxylase
MSSIKLPVGITTDEFLADYWQQKPLLIPAGIPDFNPPIDGNDLAGMALEEEIESRLVIGPDWSLEHGPFDIKRFEKLPSKNWTLLVQAVDLWVPEVAELLNYFDFLPRWRVDDVMVSYAEDGGNVGPHFDYYDVFLLQGDGQRRWQVGNICDEDDLCESNHGLKLLKNFDSVQEWVLNPGDILYLPPKIAHHGVALGPCTTFSIGFRAPAATEMLDDLATELLSRNIKARHLNDPPLTTDRVLKPISSDYINQVRSLLLETLNDDQLLGEWFAQYMSEPKYPSLVPVTDETRTTTLETNASCDKASEYITFVNGIRQG